MSGWERRPTWRIRAAPMARTSATLGLKRPGSYVWRVAARDGDGEKGPWSPTYRFRVVGEGGAVQTSSLARPGRLAEGS